MRHSNLRPNLRPAFTIMEMMISLSLFAVVASSSVLIMNNVLKSTKKVGAQVYLYNEAQAIMDQLSVAVSKNAIDYEAYYAREVLDEMGWNTLDYGYYGQTFVDPGTDGPGTTWHDGSITADYGTYCADGSSVYPDDCPDEIPDTGQLDLDVGVHTYDASTSAAEAYKNAVCESSSASCESLEYYIVDELLLVSGPGDERVVFVKELNGDENYAISKVVLLGTDSDGDGIEDLWECSADYSCMTGSSDEIPAAIDLNNGYDNINFRYISPSDIDIEEFYVYLAPIEDPFRAFGEEAEKVQIQPYVTIVLTATLSEDYGDVLGEVPSITLQRTVSTGVYSEVTSYE